MLAPRWLRLYSACVRVVHSRRAGGGGGGWRTLTGRYAEVRLWGAAAAPERLCHSDLGELYKKESVQRYLQQLMEEHEHLSDKLQRAHLSEADRKVLARRHAELLPVAKVFESVEQALRDLEEVQTLLHGEETSDHLVTHRNDAGK